ncbi:3-methyl-2-oxobutanoate hydroxymethyltransferase [Bacillus methanolicus]|uniref:3-methyl-2-oxobutanoate hydroxymethyltransferase n=1 Tax=Bacillus methanolicus (strain MGA3 / ATCC 53907) TaxID=796606 RepID=I3E9V3_BACMM|nr:3-methyl-2-oxobutanoate hydroxymethyltransferase [Bacillus methanolicus]AIE60520.1 3-methyl-2-oxobutanoatehydroxymethyltransferase [Bacillus methanolicus MGA3]EIJ83274.1 3-methyl-2-oxobutanoate hydroxymethyltransferase [Bacillus methanolicus MGA3]UQD52531.1 3-methyl-2-oxobutanoate hydroxymethyltransferase [Bacillus methanolicus]
MKQTTDFLKMKTSKEKIVMLTAYDYPSAKQAEKAEVDMILVGDSLGMVVLGYESTVPVTLEDMIHHAKAVKRGAPNTFIVVDMPFMSYHLSVRDTLLNGARLIQETGAHAVKLEGADDVTEKIKALTRAGIPVVAHLGLTPQSVGVLGGYKVQGKSAEAARKLMDDAKKVEEAGAFALVLECVPKQLAEEISSILSIPTIGIGAGPECDGQVLVYHDVLTYGIDRVPKFVKQYANVNELVERGLSAYVSEVKLGAFPEDSHSFSMKEEELSALYGGKQ